MSAAEKAPGKPDEPDATVREVESGTALRSFEERSRGLSLETQMAECIDLLQTPDVVVDDLLHSVLAIREVADQPGPPPRIQIVSAEAGDEQAFFYPSRELFVNGDGCSFTCLATELDFVPYTRGKPPVRPVRDDGMFAIDYAAVTCEARPFPVLGFTQHDESESAYPILLRALAGVVELTAPRRFDLLDRDVFKGLLGPAPVFDLALVLWDEDEASDPRRPLCELARDLAEVLKKALASEPRFPPVVNDIVCLRMNDKRFDGRLRFAWRV